MDRTFSHSVGYSPQKRLLGYNCVLALVRGYRVLA
jgi:hypothetical protein